MQESVDRRERAARVLGSWELLAWWSGNLFEVGLVGCLCGVSGWFVGIEGELDGRDWPSGSSVRFGEGFRGSMGVRSMGSDVADAQSRRASRKRAGASRRC